MLIDMHGVTYANNLLKSPAAKRHSGKKTHLNKPIVLVSMCRLCCGIWFHLKHLTYSNCRGLFYLSFDICVPPLCTSKRLVSFHLVHVFTPTTSVSVMLFLIPSNIYQAQARAKFFAWLLDCLLLHSLLHYKYTTNVLKQYQLVDLVTFTSHFK